MGKSRCMTAQMSDQVHHLPRAAVPASLIRARMALGTWGREPRGSLPRGPGGEERDRYPRPRSPSRLRRPGRFPHVALSVPVAGKPGSRQHHPPTYRTQVGGRLGGASAGAQLRAGGQLGEKRTAPSLRAPLGSAGPPRGLTPASPHAPPRAPGPSARPLLQGVLHHHGQVGHQHQGRRELAEPGAERVHPHPLRRHHGGLHQGRGPGRRRALPGGQGHVGERERDRDTERERRTRTHTHTERHTQ